MKKVYYNLTIINLYNLYSRHSVEVSLSAYMNANNLESLKFGPLTAAPSPTATTPTPGAASASNVASNANRNIRDIPEEEVTNCDLPPTIKLLVYLWDEIKSYCIQVKKEQNWARKKNLTSYLNFQE